MLHRRDLLKAAAASAVAGSFAEAQEAPEPAGLGPFDKPTAKFDKAKQDELPSWAFHFPMPIPLVARPVKIGTYEELTAQDARPFGPEDPTPIGECFHGIAAEWGETPEHWRLFGCEPSEPGAASWKQKNEHFGVIRSHVDGKPPVPNWGGFKIKCYKIPIVETEIKTPFSEFPTRFYGYAGMVPGPSLKMRIGQPAIVRFQNHLETELSIHLHGGHSPSHSDGFPTFYTLPGKSRDYFYPNILPLRKVSKDGPCAAAPGGYLPDEGEGQSTMWYHDHGMDATGYNVSKGLAGFAPCLGELELKLIKDGILPGKAESIVDREIDRLEDDPEKVKLLEDPDHPGFYRFGQEPYHNPYDVPIVIQDKVIDPETGQIAFDSDGHNGYLGDSFFLNGVPWPFFEFENRKYRFRFLNGSNARVYRLRILSEADYFRVRDLGVDAEDKDDEGTGGGRRPKSYDEIAQPFLRIGKDSWLWSKAVAKNHVVLPMANRADLVVDFKRLAPDLKADEEARFYLVDTMPQFDGRGPKAKLDDGGDPRVLPLPFDAAGRTVPELARPIALMKLVVKGAPIPCDQDAKVEHDTPLIEHHPIGDDEIDVVREFIFERGKGAWMINGRFYDPNIANATPTLGSAEEWVVRNGGGGWWHPIHIHLESHQLLSYEKDFAADEIIDVQDPPALPRLRNLVQIASDLGDVELMGLHDTQVLGPNTVTRIRMRFRTWQGPFVFHCHNLEHEDMRMMYNFEPVPRCGLEGNSEDDRRRDANVAPDARTHGDDLTLQPLDPKTGEPKIGELPWEQPPAPQTPIREAEEPLIRRRPKPKPLSNNP